GHLSVCAACAAAATEVEAESLTLREALGAEFAANVPSERLRARVDSAVAALHQAKVPAVSASRWDPFTRFFDSFRPLAYASVAAVILIAGIIGFVYWNKQKTPSVAVTNPPLRTSVAKESPMPVPPQPHNDTVKPGPSESPKFVAVKKRRPAATGE